MQDAHAIADEGLLSAPGRHVCTHIYAALHALAIRPWRFPAHSQDLAQGVHHSNHHGIALYSSVLGKCRGWPHETEEYVDVVELEVMVGCLLLRGLGMSAIGPVKPLFLSQQAAHMTQLTHGSAAS